MYVWVHISSCSESHIGSLLEETERWFIVTKEMQSVWKTDPWIMVFIEQKDNRSPKTEKIGEHPALIFYKQENWGCRWFYNLPEDTQLVRDSENLNSCLLILRSAFATWQRIYFLDISLSDN